MIDLALVLFFLLSYVEAKGLEWIEEADRGRR
jgi:hypothetical protein